MPNTDNNTNHAAGKNTIQQNRPTIPTSVSKLSGHIGTSTNGGHNKTIAFKLIMAGEKHREARIKTHIKLLTPLTPSYQKLFITLRTYFVPNQRVWKNAEIFTAQISGGTNVKINEMPNLGGKTIPIIPTLDETGGVDNFTMLSNTEQWRDSWISSYIPRMGIYGRYAQEPDAETNRAYYNVLPKYNALPLRARMAIYNDFERDKRYDNKFIEYNTDTVSNQEWQDYLPNNPNIELKIQQMRAKRPSSYYMDYRTEAQGIITDIPVNGEGESEILPNEVYENYNSLVTWAAWESKIAEARSESENEMKNPWDIIAQIRGSKKLTEGKVQLIGERTFELNYSAITQNTYNTAEGIQDEFRLMGTQGAYSYTYLDAPIYAGMEFHEEGSIHVIATVWAETVFESGFDRTMLNVEALNQYRPDMKDDKLDVLYNIETTSEWTGQDPNDTPWNEKIIGYKRKWNEYYKIPTVISGDLTSRYYFQAYTQDAANYIQFVPQTASKNEIITQNTYQFYETGSQYYFQDSGKNNLAYGVIYKNYWQDYTDILLNKNMAIMQNITVGNRQNAEQSEITIQGQNQITITGKWEIQAELPIDGDIKHNYSQWGEH